ncbi:DUF3263 domain-containing protein [Streptomyces sp. NPDC057702]|uniref:DUF3263 domain-containing protein n=1 Tax=unclassified Streptomyces TaxID=2593676 RepID=UPI003684369A
MTHPAEPDPTPDPPRPASERISPDAGVVADAGADTGAGARAGADETAGAAESDEAGEPSRSSPGSPPGEGDTLCARDAAVLAMESRGWPGPGVKERTIRERLGMSPTRYYQVLNALLDDPRALRHDPVTVHRLRRLRDDRRDRR